MGVLPRTRRRSIHDSRNLSRAPAASLRDRLRRPLTEPACRQVRQLSGSGEGPGTGQQGAVKAPGRPRRWGTLPESGRSRIRPFGRDCCQYCCQAAGQRRSQVDGCGMSVQRTDRNGRSWTTCLSLRIRRLGVRVPPSAPAKPQVRVLPWGNGRGPSLIWGPCCRGQGQLARRSAELRGRSWLAACGPRLARQRPDSCLQRTL